MAFTKEQAANINNWIASKGIQRVCPGCGQVAEYTLNDTFVALMNADIVGTKLNSSPSMTPLAMLVCNNCRHVRLFAIKEAVSLM